MSYYYLSPFYSVLVVLYAQLRNNMLLSISFFMLFFVAINLTAQVRRDSVDLYDSTRQRKIPVMYYYKENVKEKLPVVIVSHGYGANQPRSNVAYTYLTEFLANKGFFVASIQHELPTDDTLPFVGIPQIVRRPNWERGVQNILFVLNVLKKQKPELNYRKVALIGHSNGGDMSMLFAHTYPSLIDKVITLDNRRMAFPLTKKPRIYSLRSSDMAADKEVIPSIEVQKKYKMGVVYLPDTKHNDMDNNANEKQRVAINGYLLRFLKEK